MLAFYILLKFSVTILRKAIQVNISGKYSLVPLIGYKLVLLSSALSLSFFQWIAVNECQTEPASSEFPYALEGADFSSWISFSCYWNNKICWGWFQKLEMMHRILDWNFLLFLIIIIVWLLYIMWRFQDKYVRTSINTYSKIKLAHLL